ncbi:MAG: LPXTG cell wall anchor domain-containing protein [Nitrospirae bacterium]|nr:LPXTG cell wall anchor domain-containing protein [Nitrospirota bacterium]
MISEKTPRVAVDQGYRMPVEAGFVMTSYDIMLLGIAGLLLLAMLVLRKRRERGNKAS